MSVSSLLTGCRRVAPRLALTIGVASVVFVLTRVPILTLGLLERLELATLDFRFQYRSATTPPPDSTHVVIVEISEESLRSLPARFPWPRSYYAHLLRNLKAAGARAVGIDLILSATDVAADDNEFRTALRETGIGILAGKREPDREHAMIVREEEDFSNVFYRGNPALGLVNIRADADGVYRLYSPFYYSDTAAGKSRAVPTFAFAVLNTAWGLSPSTVPVREGDHLTYAGRIIPLYDPSSLLVNYYDPSRTFLHVQFQDVIDDSTFTTNDERDTGTQINTFTDPEYGYLHDGTFKDAIVLVGVTVPEYKDLFPVPVGGGREGNAQMYGVEIHANVVESVLRSEFLTHESRMTEIVLLLGLVMATFFITSGIRTSIAHRNALLEMEAVLIAAAAIALVVVGALFLFVKYSVVAVVAEPVLGIVAGYVASTAYHYVTERKQRLLIKGMFSTYVNPAVVDELLANPDKLVLGGQRKELTVLFSDIAGFTGVAETLTPEELVGLLNEYMSEMSDVILQNDGTLDKYMGDAVMAFWGAPIPQDDHPVRACRCALTMQRTLAAINEAWTARGRGPIAIRIGINTGEMIVGNMGGSRRFAYTVIGDSVNIASRLEGANKQYGTTVMVAQHTFERVRDVMAGRELDRIAVRGRSEPITVYELLGMKEELRDEMAAEFLEKYAEGIRLYREREWERALALFRAALAIRPHDMPSAMYVERTRICQANPPPASWNGVFVMETK